MVWPIIASLFAGGGAAAAGGATAGPGAAMNLGMGGGGMGATGAAGAMAPNMSNFLGQNPNGAGPGASMGGGFGSIAQGGAPPEKEDWMGKILGLLSGGGGEMGGGGIPEIKDMSNYNGIPGLLNMMNQANSGRKQGGPRPAGPGNNPYIQSLMGG